METNRQKIERWARRHLFGNEADDGDKRLTRFVLKHVTPGARGGNVIINIDRPEMTDDSITSCVDELLTMAESDAAGFGGLQTYVIQAYYDDKKPHGRITLRIEGTQADDDEFSSEPPTKSGLTGQLMRHNEALTRQLIGSQHQVLHAQGQMLQRVTEQNELLMSKHFETLQSLEEMMTQRHIRDEETRVAEAKVEAMRGLVKNVDLLVPVVARKLTKGDRKGRKALPPAAQRDPTLDIIGRLAKSLSTEQIEELAKPLSLEQRIAFMELLQAAQEGGTTH